MGRGVHAASEVRAPEARRRGARTRFDQRGPPHPTGGSHANRTRLSASERRAARQRGGPTPGVVRPAKPLHDGQAADRPARGSGRGLCRCGDGACAGGRRRRRLRLLGGDIRRDIRAPGVPSTELWPVERDRSSHTLRKRASCRHSPPNKNRIAGIAAGAGRRTSDRRSDRRPASGKGGDARPLRCYPEPS